MIVSERSGAVETLVLDRPDRHNALVPELLHALIDALNRSSTDAPAALVLAANGPSFSTGGDVRGFHEHGDALADYALDLVGLLNQAMLDLMRLPCPVLCAVQGPVCGGALGLLLASDGVIMAPGATIAPWYPVVGFSPDGGWTALLPERIGRQRCAWILSTQATIDARQALDWGLAQDLADNPRTAAQQKAKAITELEGTSLAAAKRLRYADLDAIAEGLEAERRAFVEQIVTEPARAGMRRYLKCP